MVEALIRPGRFATFVHGDLTPNNAVIGADGRCRLVDFEGAGRPHLGIDACMLRFPFAWYGRWALVRVKPPWRPRIAPASLCPTRMLNTRPLSVARR